MQIGKAEPGSFSIFDLFFSCRTCGYQTQVNMRVQREAAKSCREAMEAMVYNPGRCVLEGHRTDSWCWQHFLLQMKLVFFNLRGISMQAVLRGAL